MVEIIAGSCSIETQEQTNQVVNFLCGKCGLTYIRGGLKKYRSDSTMFQGVGLFDGIGMLEELKQKYNFKFVVEVFCENDIFALSKFADVFQIGARNAYNTELLKETNKFAKPVLYKRHMAMSLKEFVMHSKYLENKTIMCLRGDLSIHPQEQRFRSDMADIQRLREMTDHKIAYDVSHSSCDSKYVERNTLAALVYEPDYLVCEVHPSPKDALSDPDQQLDFAQFENLLAKIKQKEVLCG